MPLRTACAALLVLVLGSGCTDLVTIDVGRDRVPPIAFERELVLGGGALLGCPAGERTFDPEAALAGSASIAPVTIGCLARVRLDEAVLVESERIGAIADSIEGFDRTALVGFDVAIDELTIRGDGAPLRGESIRELTMLLDDETVLSAPEPEEVVGDRVALPVPVVDAFFEAIEARRELRVDIEVRITFREGVPLPDRLRVSMRIQPILRVDVVRAAL